MTDTIDYAATKRISADYGANGNDADSARFSAMAGTKDGRTVYNEQEFRNALVSAHIVADARSRGLELAPSDVVFGRNGDPFINDMDADAWLDAMSMD